MRSTGVAKPNENSNRERYLGDSFECWADALLWLSAGEGVNSALAQLPGSFHLGHHTLERLLHLQEALKKPLPRLFSKAVPLCLASSVPLLAGQLES